MASVFDAQSLRIYRRSLTSVAPLDRDTERDLARRWAEGDRKAGEEIVVACLPFVISIAIEYRRWGLPLEDIVQQGNLGLLRAAKRFDPERACRLATYAAYWIRAEIREYVVRAYRVVRIGTTKAERRALRAYRSQHERDPDRLAQISGLTRARVDELLPILAGRETSLDRSVDGVSFGDRAPSLEPSPEEEAADHERDERAGAAVAEALEGLTERELLIVRERMMSDDPCTLHELGRSLGVSKERVRQLEARAKDKLRGRLHALRDAS